MRLARSIYILRPAKSVRAARRSSKIPDATETGASILVDDTATASLRA
jgi:hypothetical protein